MRWRLAARSRPPPTRVNPPRALMRNCATNRPVQKSPVRSPLACPSFCTTVSERVIAHSLRLNRGCEWRLAGSRRRPERCNLQRKCHGGWRPIAQRRVRTPGVVLHSPLLDHDLRLLQRIENLPVQALVPQLPVKALAVPVLPRTARFDVQRPGSQIPQPLPQLLRYEFLALRDMRVDPMVAMR